MRTKILLGVLLVLALGFGSWKYWKDSQEKAAQEREARFTKPHEDAMNAFTQKQYIDAEAILAALLNQIEREEPGSAHEAIVLHDLGATAHVQNRNAEAIAFYKRAVEIQKKVLRPDDPDLAFSLAGLGQTLRDEGRVEEEYQIQRQMLAIYRQHPENFPRDFPMCLLNVGEYAADHHNSAEAENLLAEAATNFAKSEGSNSLHLALASVYLGDVYESEGKYAESEASYRKALAIQEARLSPDDADLGRTLNGLGNALDSEGKSAEAKSLKIQATAIYEKAGPSQTLSEGWLLNQRGQARAAEGDYRQAESLYKQAIEADETKYGAENPQVAEALEFLARLYRDKNAFPIETKESAEPIFQRILSIRQKTFGEDSPEAAETVSDLALLYYYEQKPEMGESFAARALPIEEKTLGPDDLQVSLTLNRLGLCQGELHKFADAEKSLTRALAIREKRLPPGDAWIAISVGNLADVYRAEGHAEKADLLLATSQNSRSKIAANR
jgi:tetratricopeptide (TPR) repeat protein